MSIRYKLLIAFSAIVVLSVVATTYGIHVVSGFSSLVVRLYDGPLMAVSSARSAQLDFAELRQPVERAVLLREVPPEAAVTAIESGMQQFLADLQIVSERMADADPDGQVGKTKALAESWFAMAMGYLKPPAQGLPELPVPAAFLARADEVRSAIDLVVEAASAYGFDFRTQAESSGRGLADQPHPAEHPRRPRRRDRRDRHGLFLHSPGPLRDGDLGADCRRRFRRRDQLQAQ